MIKKTLIALVILFGVYAFVKDNIHFNLIGSNSFEYQFLDREIEATNTDTFNQKKADLIQQIKSSTNSIDEYVLNYRKLLQGGRCRSIFKKTNSTQTINNDYDLLLSSFNSKNYSPVQKEVLSDYINQCLSLFEKNEGYSAMMSRLKKNFDKSAHNSKNGSDLKQVVELNDNILSQINVINQKVKTLKTKLNSEKSKNKRVALMHKISDTKGAIWRLRNKNREKYNALLKSTRSPDAIRSILYNYLNVLPHKWYLGILYKLTGINDRFVTEYTENYYFKNLLTPSIDLYVCSLGYPCDEKAYLMYCQCLGIKYKAREEACGRRVDDFILTDFLNKNMQVDALKIVKYFKEYAND
jgi:Mg2+ and Co2+ transporter CorA